MKAYLAGSGIASLAAAAYLIKDGGLLGSNITIFEQTDTLGGALDAHGSPETGYTMRGGRMFEEKFNCTYDLLSFIPSLSDPKKSVKEETMEFHEKFAWYNRARLIDNEGKITDFQSFGLSERDRIDLIKITALPEHSYDDKRIEECFSAEFFKTNFWYMWATTFAFEPWHSAMEMRRYLLRFVHLFPTMPTMSGIYRTKYNQYDAMVRPILKWLDSLGVTILKHARVTNVDFKPSTHEITATAIQYEDAGGSQEIKVDPDDLVMVINGSMVADSSFGSTNTAPTLITTKKDGSWALWQTLAKGRKEFGHPEVFSDHIEESKWESFTVTTRDPTFFDLIENFSGSEAGKGGLITFKDSAWFMTIVLNHQPHFLEQPDGVFVWWGYGLFPDRIGDYVKKKMSDCTGAEILQEVLFHLKFDAQATKIVDASIVIPTMMPYITSQFLKRKAGDRPAVIPKGSTNFAFIGQYAEVPDDVVFTVEYSVRSAQMAVFGLLKLDKRPSDFYKGKHDIKVMLEALKTMHT